MYMWHLQFGNHILFSAGISCKYFIQIWRALRLVVDSGLHHKEMKRDEALALFSKYMWDTSDVVAKEITRYESVPGM